MGNFIRDLQKEKLLGEYLDEIYVSIGLNLRRNTDIDKQHLGIDLEYGSDGTKWYIDEKAQLDYINKDLPTFTFELSYLKNNINKQGWLIDESKITTHYFLVTGITTKDKNNLSSGFTKCKITSVDRRKLLNYLESIGLNKNRLSQYEDEVRMGTNQLYKSPVEGLDFKSEGCLVYSDQLEEKPINLMLRLNFLIEKGMAKRIYPIP